MGLPLDGDGDETPRSLRVSSRGRELARRTSLPVALLDERYTTAAALRGVREMGGRHADRKGDVDALAAAVLLQQALRMRRSRLVDPAHRCQMRRRCTRSSRGLGAARARSPHSRRRSPRGGCRGSGTGRCA